MNNHVSSRLADEAGKWAWPAVAQGIYYLVTGIWPLISSRTFQKVTGPKVDLWLVKTFGVMISVVGGVVLAAGLKEAVTPQVMGLAIGSAATLAGSDVVYVAKKRLYRVYLLDALAEAGLIGLWVSTGRRK